MLTPTQNLDEAYVQAAGSGNIEAMDYILQVMLDLNTQISQECFDRALSNAARDLNFVVMTKLLDEGRANASNYSFLAYLGSAYYQAAKSANIALMDRLLALKVGEGFVQIPQNFLDGALRDAVTSNNMGMMTKLLEEGRANPNSEDTAGLTPLEYVINFYSPEKKAALIKLLEDNRVIPTDNTLRIAFDRRNKKLILKLLDNNRMNLTVHSLSNAIFFGDNEIIEKILHALPDNVDLTYCLSLVVTKNIELAKRLLNDGRFNLKALYTYVESPFVSYETKKMIYLHLPTLCEYASEVHSGSGLHSNYIPMVFGNTNSNWMRELQIEQASTFGLALAKNDLPENVAACIASFVPGFQSAKFIRRGYEIGRKNNPHFNLDWSDWLHLGGPLYSLSKWLRGNDDKKALHANPEVNSHAMNRLR